MDTTMTTFIERTTKLHGAAIMLTKLGISRETEIDIHLPTADSSHVDILDGVINAAVNSSPSVPAQASEEGLALAINSKDGIMNTPPPRYSIVSARSQNIWNYRLL